jgi:FG-GAP-like repeat
MRPLFCFVLLSLPLSAQLTLLPTRQAVLPPTFGCAAIAVGDVDGDGDLDLVIGNGNNPNQLLLNDGNGSFIDATAGRLPSPSWNGTSSVDLADVDGDGDLDLLVSNTNGTNRLYLNDGRGNFTDVTATALPPCNWSTMDQIVGDFDGDGDVDWFMAALPEHLWLNNGSGVFTDVSATNLANLPLSVNYWPTHGFAADLDGDGDLDLFLPSYPIPKILLNQGNGMFVPDPRPVPIAGYQGGFNRAVDLDLDGDLDLLLDDARYVLLNQGNGTFVNVTPTGFVITPAALDVDRDGLIDVLESTRLWHNVGGGRFTAQPLANRVTLLPVLSSATADYDGDGDMDLPGLMNFLNQVDSTAAPARGQTYSVNIHVRPAVTSLVGAFASLNSAVLPLGSLGTLRLDLSLATTLAVQPVASTPLVLSWPIPNVPAFAGVPLHYQALIVDPRTGPHLSNALRDVVQ